MSKKRFISTSFWSDPWVVDELNPMDRYLFMYLLTNEKTNIAGVYEMSLRTISYETGIEKDTLLSMLRRLDSRVVYSQGWVVIKNAIKNQNYKNEKINKGIEMALEKCPPKLLIALNLPKDWIPAVVKRETEHLQMLDDDSYMDQVSLLKLNDSDSDIDSDIRGSKEPLAEPPATIAKTPSKDIDEMFSFWADIIGYEIESNKRKNRYACSNLLKKYGKEKLIQLVNGVGLAQGDRYAPTISDYCALQAKTNELIAWGRKRETNNNKPRVGVV